MTQQNPKGFVCPAGDACASPYCLVHAGTTPAPTFTDEERAKLDDAAIKSGLERIEREKAELAALEALPIIHVAPEAPTLPAMPETFSRKFDDEDDVRQERAELETKVQAMTADEEKLRAELKSNAEVHTTERAKWVEAAKLEGEIVQTQAAELVKLRAELDEAKQHAAALGVDNAKLRAELAPVVTVEETPAPVAVVPSAGPDGLGPIS